MLMRRRFCCCAFCSTKLKIRLAFPSRVPGLLTNIARGRENDDSIILSPTCTLQAQLLALRAYRSSFVALCEVSLDADPVGTDVCTFTFLRRHSPQARDHFVMARIHDIEIMLLWRLGVRTQVWDFPRQ